MWPVGSLAFFDDDSILINDGCPRENIGTNLMQFTGLTDKNGREIFEGDIIESLWVVCWHDGRFVLDDRGSKEEFCAATVRHDAIIGNVHENPDLLPKEDAQ